MIEELTSEDLDYLQRTGFEPPRLAAAPLPTCVPEGLRSLWRIDGVGRLGKERPVHSVGTGHDDPRPVAADLLAALHTHRVPVAFIVEGGHRVAIRVGTWLPAGGDPATVAANTEIVQTGLRSLFPSIDLHREGPHSSATATNWERGGLALGIPTWTQPGEVDGAVPLDKLLRGMAGTRWAAVVLAQPVEEVAIGELRLRLLNEMRSTSTTASTGGFASALADHYLELLKAQLAHLTDGQASGAWRTAVYLLGDNESYWRVAGLWRGLWSGRRSVPEPVRVFDRDEAPAMAGAWSLPEPVPDIGAPGHYGHPFQHQTLLTSSQLAAYVDFPTVETAGFAIRRVPNFDTVPPPLPAPDQRPIVLGTVVERDRVTAAPYGVRLNTLNRHVFVTGVTGAGKTNTMFHLLRQTAGAGVPFLVIEPAKTEYRVLLRDHDLGSHLRVLTLGNEGVSPFRLNPFEVPEGIPVSVHLDLLRSVFSVSFGMWTPLPQVLEQSLHELYRDWGWDVTTDINRRLTAGGDRRDAFPRLTDLVHKVEEIAAGLGYDEESTSNVRAALRTRLDSLRTGGKGRMLDVRRSLPLGPLLSYPTVVELDGLGDDDDKAFVMGLLMIRIAEHRRTQGDVDGLTHLMVIEEAHRLLANPGPRMGEEHGDPRGKAVETFTNLLSEVRAYGQGMVVVDQVPTKLAPDVLKNTNLKVAHRVVAGDDREALGSTMGMDERQRVAMGGLPPGRAAVHADTEDAPLLVQVPLNKGGSGTWPTDAEVREAMAARGAGQLDPEVMLGSGDCDQRCLDDPQACEAARFLADDIRVRRTVGRVLLSAAFTPGGLERTWPDVAAAVSARAPQWVDEDALLHCLSLHATQLVTAIRGARAGWSYEQTTTVARLADGMITTHLRGANSTPIADQLRRSLLDLRGDRTGPFPHCRQIWEADPRACLCNDPVAELVAGGAFQSDWEQARTADRQVEFGYPSTWAVCAEAAFHLTEFPDDDQDPAVAEALDQTARCTALCFAQHMLTTEPRSHPGIERRVMAHLFLEAQPLELDDFGDVDEDEEEVAQDTVAEDAVRLQDPTADHVGVP